jgi:hypothetical protein
MYTGYLGTVGHLEIGLTLNNLNVMFLCIAESFSGTRRNGGRSKGPAVLVPLVLLCLWVLFLFVANNAFRVVWLRLGIIPVVVYATTRVRSISCGSMAVVYGAAVIGGLLLSGAIVSQLYGHIELWGLAPVEDLSFGPSGPRPAGFHRNPNAAAVYLLMALAATFGLWQVTVGRYRKYIPLAIISIGYGLIATGSRAALLGVIFGLSVVGTAAVLRDKRRGFLTVILFVVFSLLAMAVLFEKQAIRDVLGHSRGFDIQQERGRAFSGAIETILEHPILGDMTRQTKIEWSKNFHNELLQVAASTGLVGGILAIFVVSNIVLISTRRFFVKSRPDSLVSLFLVAGVLAYGMGHVGFLFSAPFWIMLMLINERDYFLVTSRSTIGSLFSSKRPRETFCSRQWSRYRGFSRGLSDPKRNFFLSLLGGLNDRAFSGNIAGRN